MSDDYNKARKSGEQAFQRALREGRHPYLPVLDSFLDEKQCSAVKLGVMEIPLSLVIGTKTAGRQQAFACNFMPVMDKDSEFGIKWSRLYESQVAEGMRDPVIVYEYLHYFYVQEGNKRVSVARYLDMPTINADVRRLSLPKQNAEETDVYDEFLKFYAVCPLYELNFTKKGSYLKFAQELNLDLKNKWDEITVSRVKSAFYNFRSAYLSLEQDTDSAKESDAFLLYVTVYGFDKLRFQSPQTVRKNILQIRKEMITQSSDDNIAVKENPQEKKDSGLLDFRKILPAAYSASRPLKIAFVYERNSQDSAWTYEHEVGRRYLNKKYGALVQTVCYEDCGTGEKLEQVLKKAAADHDMVFTVSPSMMKQTLKAAITYPKTHFLNCSINLSSKAVRTYYVRMYGVKFLMGALAAMYSENHKICYIADYPIYGTIASINAFAIGASLIDPQIKVYLGWSGVHDSDWFKELDYLGIDVFSGPDSVSIKEDNPVYGLSKKEKDGRIVNLAVPVINWAKYYERLIDSVLDGSWDLEEEAHKLKSINYWWGMSVGVCDLNISSQIAYSSEKMIRLLKDGLIAGTINPFAGELRSSKGMIQPKEAGRLSNESIIRKDWLNENIIGVIPEYERLSEDGKKLTSVSGVSSAKEKI
ncbi:MAG: BMP family ABC transporter substrate-binding protein [Solobacterium sp.]|nr:BMP family ABC transporter substrate-binding protein [Solobacterium sp.]